MLCGHGVTQFKVGCLSPACPPARPTVSTISATDINSLCSEPSHLAQSCWLFKALSLRMREGVCAGLALRQGGVRPAQSSSDSIEGLARLNGIYTICTRHPRNVWHRNLTNGKNESEREKDGWREGGKAAVTDLWCIIPWLVSNDLFSFKGKRWLGAVHFKIII